MKPQNLNILILDDDDFQRQILLNILHSLGATSIREAENGVQALEIIREATSNPIEVVLCDLNMPEMDGMEFLRHIGKEHHNIAVIISSALDSKLLASVGRMTELHGIKLLGAIEKPVMLATLKELLAKYDKAENALNKAAVEKTFTLDEILQGISAKQFEPFFQPKVDLATGRLVGAEALARWIHPQHGVVGPYVFISLLEQNGKLDELTFMMLEKAACACRSFHENGHILTVSVNLSLTSLNDTSLADKIIKTVREAGIAPQYIVLEITESAAMTDGAAALENLARLCMNGFSLSIDDYGTGFSSLQQLTRIAFSELKIDQSFVKDFASNEALRIMVESSVDMARKLHIKSVAEGVETLQDWNSLKGAGCDTVQGYYIAKPMPVSEFSEFINNYKFVPAAIVTKPEAQPAASHPKIQILIVEDDDFTRKIVLRVLHDFGFTNTIDVNSAQSAIKLLEVEKFDLIITDVNMPEMNGLKFVQMIRAGKTHAKPETRIMVLTSFSQTEILGTALALDINGFLVKPIIPAVVEQKLAQAMSERLHLHSPIAYETIKTELKSLPSVENNRAPNNRGEKAITLSNGSRHNEQANARHLSIRWLRPQMILNEDVYLKDGTMLLSSGHRLTELSINRLNDLEILLPANGIAVLAEA
jgi:EAL domain-containing protein (putative c-di-GMP-specific phosphodiesterase class I)/DNA-binding response OmpR family regulator